MENKQKYVGIFRKSKAYGLICGLSFIFLTTGMVDAQTTEQSLPDTMLEVSSSNQSNLTDVERMVQTIEKQQLKLDELTKTARSKNIQVTVDSDVYSVELTKDNFKEKGQVVLDKIAEQVAILEKAIHQQDKNEKVVVDGNTDIKKTVSESQAKLNQQATQIKEKVAVAKKNDVVVKEKETTLTPEYKSLETLSGEKLKETMIHNLNIYKQNVASGSKIQADSLHAISDSLDTYLKKIANYQSGTSYTGLKWKDGVEVVANENVTKMSGTENVVDWTDGSIKHAAMVATQGLNYSENKDAQFDNIFKINDWSKFGSVIIKNTTNGDVKLAFGNYVGNFTGKYFAVWGAKDGGIAWSVFGTNSGSGTSNAGESGSGGGSSVKGRQLAVIRSYGGYIETLNPVSVVTLNDIDNKQIVKMNTGNVVDKNAELGSNVKQQGNDFLVGSGDVSQGSLGKLGSNGIRWNLDKGEKVVVSFTHDTNSNRATSVVAGAFGELSNIVEVPKKPELEAHYVKVTPPKEAENNEHIVVPVKQYEVSIKPEEPVPPKPTPTPIETVSKITQQSILPFTGEATVSNGLLGLMAVLASVGILHKKKDN